MSLTKRLLKRADLTDPAIVQFTCGALQRDADVADFLRADEIIDLVESGELSVWIYRNNGNELVGFSSLGKTMWGYPKPNGAKIPIQIIPNLAVSSAHQGKKYSKQILDDTIAEAIDRKGISDLLGLMVYVDNLPAIGLYVKTQFVNFANPRPNAGQPLQRMLLKLP